MEGLCSNSCSKNKPSKRLLANAMGNSKAGNKVPASNMVRLITLLLFFMRYFPGVTALFWIDVFEAESP